MNIDYTWDIVKVNYVLKEGNLYYVIKNIEYKYTGIDSETGNSFVVPGNVDLKNPIQTVLFKEKTSQKKIIFNGF